MCTKTVSRFFSLAELITPMHTKSMYNNSAVQIFFLKKSISSPALVIERQLTQNHFLLRNSTYSPTSQERNLWNRALAQISERARQWRQCGHQTG